MNRSDDRKIFISIRDVLAELYPSEVDARRIAADAGVNVMKVNFSSSAINFWDAILAEAYKSFFVKDLLNAVYKEYSTNIRLTNAHDAYQHRVEGKSDRNVETISSILNHTTGLLPELPYGTVSPTSHFYIERHADRSCRLFFRRDLAGKVFIKGPSQVGKSSLMHRITTSVKEEHNVAVAYITLGRFDKPLLMDLESFLIELCGQITDVLHIPDEIERYWSSRRRSILVKCSNYVASYVIKTIERPLILVIDELEKLLDSPFRNDFFGMLRSWHNDRAHDQKFQKLSLFLGISTEPHLLIDNPNQSPFNVAQPIELNDFTLERVMHFTNVCR